MFWRGDVKDAEQEDNGEKGGGSLDHFLHFYGKCDITGRWNSLKCWQGRRGNIRTETLLVSMSPGCKNNSNTSLIWFNTVWADKNCRKRDVELLAKLSTEHINVLPADASWHHPLSSKNNILIHSWWSLKISTTPYSATLQLPVTTAHLKWSFILQQYKFPSGVDNMFSLINKYIEGV